MSKTLNSFFQYCNNLKKPKVLELGTKQSIPGRSTMHKEWIPHALIYNGTDIEKGTDVDIIGDVHNLSSIIGHEQYDVIISCSSFEHFKYPHVAAFELSKILRLNGAIFIQTHFTFPLHAYPNDYFRFSVDALTGLFGTKNGVQVMETDYEFPCKIKSDRLSEQEGWLNSLLFAIKLEKTPQEYQYD